MNNNWQYRKIGDICTVERGGSPRPIDKFITESDEGVNWIKIGDTNDSMYITETAQKIIPEGMKKSRYVQPGDFLLSNSMSFGRPYILKIDGCIHDGWLVLRDKDNSFEKRFLYYCLSSKSTFSKFKSMAVGGVVNNLNSDMVRKVEIPVPPKDEQNRIADLLDSVNEIIIKRKQELQTLDDLVKARFVEMFGDPVINEKQWTRLTLGDICEIGSSKRVFEKDYVESGVPFFRTKEIVELSKGQSISTELFISEEHFSELKNKYVVPKKNDLLISAVGTIGAIWIVDGSFDFYFKDGNLIIIKSSEQFNSVYMKYLLYELVDNYKKGMSTGTAYSALTIAGLKKMLVYDVPIELQNIFSDFVQEVDKSKVVVQKALDEAQLLFDSLMQQYFG